MPWSAQKADELPNQIYVGAVGVGIADMGAEEVAHPCPRGTPGEKQPELCRGRCDGGVSRLMDVPEVGRPAAPHPHRPAAIA